MDDSMPTTDSVVVVGGGLGGLVVAHELARAGVDCRVLEAAGRPGGRVESTTYPDGVSAEAHMEEFWESNPIRPLLDELGLPLVEDVAHSSVVIDGRLHPYCGDGDRDQYLSGIFDDPEREEFLLFNARASGDLRTLEEAGGRLSGAGHLTDLARTSLAEHVRHVVPLRRVREWIRIVVESETAVGWEQICALDGLAELAPFLDTDTGFGETNAHVVGGNDRLVEALVARLPDGTIRTGTRVVGVREDRDAVVICHRDTAGVDALTRAGRVVLMVPTWSLSEIDLGGTLGARARHAVDSTGAGSYVKVLVRLRREALSLWECHGPGLFTLLTDAAVGCLYLTDPGQPRDLVLTMLVPGRHAVRLSGCHRDDIGRMAVQSLVRHRLVWDGDVRPRRWSAGLEALVTDVQVHDYPRAVAYWPVDRGRSRFDADSWALREPHGRVHVGGDTTESSHSDGAVRSAYRIASQILADLGGSRPQRAPEPA